MVVPVPSSAGASPAERALGRLERARRTGPGRWTARCPAHDDQSPSLAVRELDDGRLLLRCFAGCDIEAIVAAMGLRLADLFPDAATGPAGAARTRERRPWSAADLLELAAHEAGHAAVLVTLCSADLAGGHAPAPESLARLQEAAQRLLDMREACHVGR